MQRSKHGPIAAAYLNFYRSWVTRPLVSADFAGTNTWSELQFALTCQVRHKLPKYLWALKSNYFSTTGKRVAWTELLPCVGKSLISSWLSSRSSPLHYVSGWFFLVTKPIMVELKRKTSGENMFTMEVGRRVFCDGHYGTIRFIGEVPPTKGIWLGIDWDHPLRGKHDGTYNGVQYFTAS